MIHIFTFFQDGNQITYSDEKELAWGRRTQS